jgi:uncharacterized iron-regulated membrane protein
MEGDVLMFAQVMTVILASVAALVGIGLTARVVWMKGSRVKPGAGPRIDDGRLDRLEAAVDAIAIEVERISEGQRFTVGLLTERLPARSPDRLGELASPTKRTNTPH